MKFNELKFYHFNEYAYISKFNSILCFVKFKIDK